MICKLCHEIKTLVNSHIISEFFYSPIYDTNHRFPVIKIDPKEKNKSERKGFREYLLCIDCEKKFYEKYVREFLYGNRTEYCEDHWNEQSINGHNLIEIDNVDYNKFKLFQLSILWRASIASEAMWSPVKLGKKHEEKIRNMLMNGNPGEPDDYGCCMMGIENEGKNLTDLIFVEKIRIDKHNGYRFIFGGFIWLFVVSSHFINSPIKPFFLQKSGPLRTLKTDLSNIDYLNNDISKLKINKKIPTFNGNTIVSLDSKNE